MLKSKSSARKRRRKKRKKGIRGWLTPTVVFYSTGAIAAFSMLLVMARGEQFIFATGIASVLILVVLYLNDKGSFSGKTIAENDSTYRKKFLIVESFILFVLLLVCIFLTIRDLIA